MKWLVICVMGFLVSLSTFSLAQDTIQVQAGWNIIGTGSTLVVRELRSEPAAIVISDFYGYTKGVGYSRTDTLITNTGYWVKANQAGILIGGTAIPKPISCGKAVVYGGRGYNTVLIGSQCWFMQNLDVGTMIAGTSDQTDNSSIEKYCYSDDPANCATYGGLYQWNEAMQYSITSGSQGICPMGWHIPTSAEFDTLHSSVNGDGNSLKTIGQGIGDGAGTNTSGFSALLAGFRHYSGYFDNLGGSMVFWSSTQYIENLANLMSLYNNSSFINVGSIIKSYGVSVRCLKD